MGTDVIATAEPVAEMNRLGDEIAELSAHLEAAGARLLDLIREFDAPLIFAIIMAYGITSFARDSIDGGIVRPSAFAALSRVEDWRKAP